MTTIQEDANATKHFYKVWFSNGVDERTAAIVVDTTQFPFGKTSLAEYSRLFPETTKPSVMKVFCQNWPDNTWEEAFARGPSADSIE